MWLGVVGVRKIWGGGCPPPPSIGRLGWEWPPFSWTPVGIRIAAGGSSTLRAEVARLVVVVTVCVLRVVLRAGGTGAGDLDCCDDPLVSGSVQ